MATVADLQQALSDNNQDYREGVIDRPAWVARNQELATAAREHGLTLPLFSITCVSGVHTGPCNCAAAKVCEEQDELDEMERRAHTQ